MYFAFPFLLVLLGLAILAAEAGVAYANNYISRTFPQYARFELAGLLFLWFLVIEAGIEGVILLVGAFSAR